ncbi:fructosamine kinase family protein [Cellulomonas sp. ATA003]|uniref:fructosamine kinase family protein n=1 Tax=Cellulomonas sp. ATA003 TaxID=3073064 RepID=UPI0028732AF0|nr:fructosamine kinase family protein [Cellulomonas sp. ATA003]WNB86833.1 fructosamine kinase family protein [Cellulomonas sp. ATA003]
MATASTPDVFRKQRADAPPGFLACEAAGLRWLGDAGPDAVPVVRVLDVGPGHLDLERLVPAVPTPTHARELGRRLAHLHDAGAEAFGVTPPGWDGDGYFGPLDEPLPMPAGRHDRWGEFLAERRLEPMRALLSERGRLSRTLAGDLDRLAARLRSGDLDDDDVPARVHGDLWSGNVVWTASGAVLVDPAAHGGHRESDLAMLALFGLPGLADVVAGYGEVHPLRPRAADRMSLHQLYPVGMHAVLFGDPYVARTEAIAARWARG